MSAASNATRAVAGMAMVATTHQVGEGSPPICSIAGTRWGSSKMGRATAQPRCSSRRVAEGIRTEATPRRVRIDARQDGTKSLMRMDKCRRVLRVIETASGNWQHVPPLATEIFDVPPQWSFG